MWWACYHQKQMVPDSFTLAAYPTQAREGHAMKFRSALSFRSAAPVVTALCLLALAGCARTTGSARPAANPEVRPTDAPNQGVPTASKVISPRQDTWNFDASPDPAPSARPLYRMNEITFDFNSTAFGK